MEAPPAARIKQRFPSRCGNTCTLSPAAGLNSSFGRMALGILPRISTAKLKGSLPKGKHPISVEAIQAGAAETIRR